MPMMIPTLVARIPYGPNLIESYQNPTPTPGQNQTTTLFGYNSRINLDSGTYMFIVQIYNGENVTVLQNFYVSFQ